MPELPFAIEHRAGTRGRTQFLATHDDEQIAIETYAPADGKERARVAAKWAEDTRLQNGQAIEAIDVERALERAELDSVAAQDRADDRVKPPRAKHEGFHCTDLGNAERLVSRYGEFLRFWATSDTRGVWLSWDGRRWCVDTRRRVHQFAKNTARAIYGEAAACDDPMRRGELSAWAQQCESKGRLDAMVDLAARESSLIVEADELDQDPWSLNVANGTINLRDGTLRDHRREDMITKLSDVQFDPGAACPIWDQFLDTIMEGQSELVEYLRRVVGYALTGITTEQCLFFAWGKGSNGKSTFLTTVREMLGDYGHRARAEAFMITRADASNETALANMRGSRLVVISEIEEGRRFAEGMVKDLTGGESVQARFLYATGFEYTPTFKLAFCGNHKPTIRGTDHGIWRRIRLIPFCNEIAEKDQDQELPGKLKAEFSGILNWALEGCKDWRADGLQTPGQVKAATEEYRTESDVFGEFIAERCETGPYGIREYSIHLYAAYKSWADECGHKTPSRQKFGRQLADRGFTSKEDSEAGPMRGKTVWQGIRLRDDGTK